jgi:hypothetical protein
LDFDGRDPLDEYYLDGKEGNYENEDVSGEGKTVYIFYIDDFDNQANWQKEQLESQGYDVVMIDIYEEAQKDNPEIANYTDDQLKKDDCYAKEFEEQWNNLPDEEIDQVYIFAHGSERMLQFYDGSSNNAMTIDGTNSKGESIGNLNDLEEKNINELHIQACNTGHVDAMAINGINVASLFCGKIGNNNTVYAWDGSVGFGYYWGWYSDLVGYYKPRLSNNQDHFKDLIKNEHWPKRDPYGEVAYKNGLYDPNICCE